MCITFINSADYEHFSSKNSHPIYNTCGYVKYILMCHDRLWLYTFTLRTIFIYIFMFSMHCIFESKQVVVNIWCFLWLYIEMRVHLTRTGPINATNGSLMYTLPDELFTSSLCPGDLSLIVGWDLQSHLPVSFFPSLQSQWPPSSTKTWAGFFSLTCMFIAIL